MDSPLLSSSSHGHGHSSDCHGHSHSHGHGHSHSPVHETKSLWESASCACRQCLLMRTNVPMRQCSSSSTLLTASPPARSWGGHDHDPAEHIGDTGVAQTMFNIINLVVGGGVLSMPYVCKLSGWFGIAIIAATAVVFCFNAVVIGAILRQQHDWFEHHEVPKDSRDYVQLGKLAFGKWGAGVTAMISVLENWSAAICYLVFVGANLRLVTGLPVNVGVFASGLLSLAMLFMPLGMLSYLGVIGMFFAAGAVSMLVVQGMAQGVSTAHMDINPAGAGTALGVVFFCFAGHACLPNVYWSMRHPKEKYAQACTAAYSSIFAFYATSAAVGYYYFGTALTNSFTEALTTPSLLLPATAGILVKVQTAVPPNLAPPVLVIESMLGLRNEIAKLACRCVIVGVSIGIAAFCSGSLTQLVAISGYLTTGYDSLIFPSLAALKLGTATSLRVVHGTMAALGIAVCLGGTYVSVRGM